MLPCFSLLIISFLYFHIDAADASISADDISLISFIVDDISSLSFFVSLSLLIFAAYVDVVDTPFCFAIFADADFRFFS